MVKNKTIGEELRHENKMHELKTILIHSDLVASECLRSMVHDPDFFEEITDEDIAELLAWAGEEDITVEDIREHGTCRELFTMGDIYCPKCGKELVRLEEDCNGKSQYWCDDCNLDIVIMDGNYEEDLDETLKDVVYRRVGDHSYTNDIVKEVEQFIDQLAFEYEIDDDHNKSLLGMACDEIEFDGETKKEIRINFGSDNVDETSFDVSSFEELYECWCDFCKENNLDQYTTSINFVDDHEIPEEECSDTCCCDRCKSCSDKECNGASPKVKCEKHEDSFEKEFLIKYLKNAAHSLAKDIKEQRKKMNDLQKTIINYDGDILVGRVIIDEPEEIKEFLRFLDRI